MGTALHRQLNYLLWVTVITYLLGGLAFAEPFRFIQDLAYSHIGRYRTYHGQSNVPAMVLFSVSLLLSARICFRIDWVLPKEYDHHLFLIAGAGYILMLAPCDVWYIIHSTGAVLVFGSFWFFVMYNLIRLRSSLGWKSFVMHQLLLQGTILPYAILYMAGSPLNQAFQKLAIIGIMISLKSVGHQVSQHIEEDGIVVQ